MKKYYMMILAVALTISGCSDFLDRDPDDYIGGEMVYGDEKLASAAVANLYGRVYWGQNIDQDKLYIYLDEACLSSGSPDNTYGFSNEFMRVYEYSLLRDSRLEAVATGRCSERYTASIRWIELVTSSSSISRTAMFLCISVYCIVPPLFSVISMLFYHAFCKKPTEKCSDIAVTHPRCPRCTAAPSA